MAQSERGRARSTPLASSAKSRPSFFNCSTAAFAGSLRLRARGPDDGLVRSIVPALERGEFLGRGGFFGLHRLARELLRDRRHPRGALLRPLHALLTPRA